MSMYGHNSGAREEFELAEDEAELLRREAEFMLKPHAKNRHLVVSGHAMLDAAGNEVMEQYGDGKAKKTRPRPAYSYLVFDFQMGRMERYSNSRTDFTDSWWWSQGALQSTERFSNLSAQERVFLDVARKIWRKANGLPEAMEIK